MCKQQTACALQTVSESRRCAKLINVRKYKVWCGCLLIGRVPRSFWDATFQDRPRLCVYMITVAVSSVKWRKIEDETVKLIKSKTREKICHHWSVLSVCACVQRTIRTFFLSVDLYSLYSSSCSLPIFLFLQPLFLICLYQLAIWRTCTFPLKIYGTMSHVRKAKTRFGLLTPTIS